MSWATHVEETLSDGELVIRGLTGGQLRLKVTGFRRAVDRFRSAATDRLKKGFFRRGLRWANIILGSLGGVFVAAELIKEFKESIEASVDDREEADRLARGA